LLKDTMEHLPTSFKLLHEVDTLLSETVVIYHIVNYPLMAFMVSKK